MRDDDVVGALRARLPSSLLYVVLSFAPRGLDRHRLVHAFARFGMGLFLRRIGCEHLRRVVLSRVPVLTSPACTIEFRDDALWFTATFLCRPRARLFRVTDYVVIHYA